MKLVKVALSTATVLATLIATTSRIINQALDILNTVLPGEPLFTLSE